MCKKLPKGVFRSLSVFLLITFLLTSGLSCSKGGSAEAVAAMKKVKLNFWTVFDDRSAYAEVIQDYQTLHPNVTIVFKKLTYEEYERELLEAFALDEGPDIFSLHNTWINKYQNLATPAPAQVRLPFKKIAGTVKKEEVVEIESIKLPTPNEVRAQYGDTVASDVVWPVVEGKTTVPKVFGLPIALDTLALYYNKDILNAAGIAEPAQFWTDIQTQVERLRKVDGNGNILLAALPIGTATNVARSFDILSLIMMQLKTQMVQGNGEVNFHVIPNDLVGNENITQPPGINALEFYTSFADSILSSYTWNDRMPNSLDAFIAGKSAYYLGYAYDRPLINAQPKLNYSIAPMLQVSGYDRVNYANYWVNTVARKSKNQDWAWDFVRFMASKEEAKKYCDKAERPAALRSLYDYQVGQETLKVFAEQTLTSKSWYRGVDARAAEDIFSEMITSVNKGEATAKDAVGLAVSRIQQTWRK